MYTLKSLESKEYNICQSKKRKKSSGICVLLLCFCDIVFIINMDNSLFIDWGEVGSQMRSKSV